jgi:hypothetical protein
MLFSDKMGSLYQICTDENTHSMLACVPEWPP